jgi:16S rRNA (cytosine967-C5)-methyltransferase
LAQTWQQHDALSTAQRGAIQDLSYGTLRDLGRFRAMVDHMVARAPDYPLLRALLWVALYQLTQTRAAHHAVVNSAVATSAKLVSPALRGFVNALLRRYLRESADLDRHARSTDEGRYSYPKWWIDKVRQEYAHNWKSILQSGNDHPPLTLRVNLRRCDPAHYLDQLRALGMSAHPIGDTAIRLDKPVPVAQLPGFSQGLVSVQDAGAQWVPRLLDLQDGQRVLDACAAPGGKTAHMLEARTIDLTAIDVDPTRLKRVDENLSRLGLSARSYCADARQATNWWDSRPFDRILADVPCSASGVVRRHPDIKWLRRPDDFPALVRQQRELVDALWKLLARGGKLLYVTCSIFTQENSQQVQNFLLRQRDAEQLPLDSFADSHGQLLPGTEHDGFYYALLRKKTDD